MWLYIQLGRIQAQSDPLRSPVLRSLLFCKGDIQWDLGYVALLPLPFWACAIHMQAMWKKTRRAIFLRRRYHLWIDTSYRSISSLPMFFSKLKRSSYDALLIIWATVEGVRSSVVSHKRNLGPHYKRITRYHWGNDVVGASAYTDSR